MDRARMKLGDKVTIPAVVEEIEYTTMGRISYKVEPLIAWFDADEIEALKQTEIVRCKDCIHCADDWNGNEPMFTCELARCCESVYPDDYCSYGEKQVIGKLNNPDDSLVREDSEACKEQKSKLDTDLISQQAVIGLLLEALEAQDRDRSGQTYEVIRELLHEVAYMPSEENLGEVSDGYHTFNQLYHQRAVLFATIVNQNKDKAWKPWKHEDGQFCFDKEGEWFIVGVDTPEGSYTYHYEHKYWDMFDCEELDRGKHWDGHTEEDVTRLLSLPPVEPKPVCEDAISRNWILRTFETWQKVSDYNEAEQNIISAAICEVKDAPPVEPKRPKGEWQHGRELSRLYIGDALRRINYEDWHCSICHCVVEQSIKPKWSYCPNCGADMRGADGHERAIEQMEHDMRYEPTYNPEDGSM